MENSWNDVVRSEFGPQRLANKTCAHVSLVDGHTKVTANVYQGKVFVSQFVLVVFRYDVFIDRDETSSFQAMHGHYRESVKLWQSPSNKIGPRNEITDHPIDPLS